MWHGGGLTGATWETTPDGREGWQHFFLRRGWPVYVSDAVERGRSGWTMIPEQTGGEPVYLPEADPWTRFRIGPPGSFPSRATYPGCQFPADAASYRNFVRQVVPRFTTTDELTLEAYLALLDRVEPDVVVAHSQAGLFGWRAAQERPDKVRALVLVEPAAVGDTAKAAALKDMPVLMLYGDFIAQDARWPAIRANGVRFAEARARRRRQRGRGGPARARHPRQQPHGDDGPQRRRGGGAGAGLAGREGALALRTGRGQLPPVGLDQEIAALAGSRHRVRPERLGPAQGLTEFGGSVGCGGRTACLHRRSGSEGVVRLGTHHAPLAWRRRPRRRILPLWYRTRREAEMDAVEIAKDGRVPHA